MATSGGCLKPIYPSHQLAMPRLPDFRRTRSRGVRLVPMSDLHDVQLLLAAVLFIQALILIGAVW
jgi:hypothetical protein